MSRIGTSIRPAPCADDIKKDQPKRPRAPIRMPKPRGCARWRQSRYNAKPNRTAAPVMRKASGATRNWATATRMTTTAIAAS